MKYYETLSTQLHTFARFLSQAFSPVQGLVACACAGFAWGLNSCGLVYEPENPCPEQNTEIAVTYDRQWQFPKEGGVNWRSVWSPEYYDTAFNALLPSIPEGLSVLSYVDDVYFSRHNIGPNGGSFNLLASEQSLIVYNYDTEYIVFSGMEYFHTTYATTRPREFESVPASPYAPEAEGVMTQPDVLFRADVDDHEVDPDGDKSVIHLTLTPVVYTYVICYEVTEGMNVVTDARGAISGVASGVWLSTGLPSTQTTTIIYDCMQQPWGEEAVVRTFGAPSGYADETFGLLLELKLSNGNIATFNFDITEQMRAQPRGGVIVVRDIQVDESSASGSADIFDVDVDEWGEFENIPIPLSNVKMNRIN